MQLFNGKTITLALLVVFLYAGMTSLVNLFVENDTINQTPNLAALNTLNSSSDYIAQSSADYSNQSSSTYVPPAPISPVASIISPADNSVVSGTVTLSATSLNSGTFSSLQFFINGSPINGALSNPVLPCSISWDSTQVSNGTYTLSVVGITASNEYPTATITITVNNTVNNSGSSNNSNNSAGGQNSVTPPAIYAVSASSVTSGEATISWITDELSDSQIHYSTDYSYGNSSPYDSQLTTTHAEFLSNLLPNTLYHYVVLSANVSGGLGHSGDNTFTTLAEASTNGSLPPSSNPNTYQNPGVENNVYTTHAYVPPAPPLPPTKLSKNLKLNDSGPEVLLLQKTLNALGFTLASTGPGSLGKETSRFDANTQQALIQYQETQSASGIVPSGILDNATMLLINSDISRLNAQTESATSTGTQSDGNGGIGHIVVNVLNSAFSSIGNLWITLFAKNK